MVTGSVVCTIKSKTSLKMFFITAKRKKKKKKNSKSGRHGEAALSLHASISRGKQDQRMFSKPQPADLIIGWFPVCFPSLADTGQKHLLTKRGHRAVESGPSHFCIPSSIPPSMLDWLVLMASWENGGFSFFSQTMSLLEVASKDNCGKSNLFLDLRKTPTLTSNWS